MPKKDVYKALVLVIQRYFKVQEHVHPEIPVTLDKYPTVMFGILTDSTMKRNSSCNIDLMPGAAAKMLRSYRITPLERDELDTQVAKMLEKYWFPVSNSQWASQVWFVQNYNWGLRMFVDFRKLNAQAIRI